MASNCWINWWFDDGNKNLTILNFKHIRRRNAEEFGKHPEINFKRQWGIRTNGAVKGNPNHTCLDWQLDLGHIHINYTDFNYNQKHRKSDGE